MKKRWQATLYYKCDAGTIDVIHDIEEIEELHDIVERGPDWNALDRIVITLARKSRDKITVEKAAQL